jgi:polyphosphate glucokinase
MIETMKSIVENFKWSGSIGCGFPAPIVHGKPHLASNISDEWMKLDIVKTLADATGCRVAVANDADVAGLAEMRFGAGRNRDGLVIIVTLGTGIGSALFMDGKLVPNTELGHIEINGKEAERWAATVVREKEDLSWKKWAKRVNTYLERMQLYFWPELFIIGGGVSKRHEKFFPYLTVDCEVLPARLRNQAGIIGAATLAAESL